MSIFKFNPFTQNLDIIGEDAAAGSGFNIAHFEATAGQTVFNLPFTLATDHLIFLDGNIEPAAGYSGVSSDVLTFNQAKQEYTQIYIISSK